MDHFIAEKYDYRLLCIRYLVHHGWRWFGEEIPADRGARSGRYLRTGDDALLDPVDEPPWFTSGVLATTTQPTASLDAAQRRFLEAVRRVAPDVHWFGFDADSSDHDYLAQANAATTYEALRPAMATRERIMHRRVRQVLDAHPGEKVALLAASAHLLKDDDAYEAPGVGAGPGGSLVPSLGHQLAQDLPDEAVLSFWLLHGEGSSANPYLPPPARLHPAAGTFDDELVRRGIGPSLIRVSEDTERRSVTGMHNLAVRCRFSEQVDAIVFAPTVHALAEDLVEEVDHGAPRPPV